MATRCRRDHDIVITTKTIFFLLVFNEFVLCDCSSCHLYRKCHFIYIYIFVLEWATTDFYGMNDFLLLFFLSLPRVCVQCTDFKLMIPSQKSKLGRKNWIKTTHVQTMHCIKRRAITTKRDKSTQFCSETTESTFIHWCLLR